MKSWKQTNSQSCGVDERMAFFVRQGLAAPLFVMPNDFRSSAMIRSCASAYCSVGEKLFYCRLVVFVLLAISVRRFELQCKKLMLAAIC